MVNNIDNDLYDDIDIVKNIGIDLGTTNTVVSYVDENGVIKVLNIGKTEGIPSTIFFESKERVFFGEQANQRRKNNPNAFIHQFKRQLGANSKKFNIILKKSKNFEKKNKNYYVIDTNCFIDKYNILQLLTEDDVAVLPFTVVQELLHRSKQQETKYRAEAAIRIIENAEDKLACEILFMESDISLLPEDFLRRFKPVSENDGNDDKILSIALKLKEYNPILITTDGKLRKEKAKHVNVRALTLKDFNLNKISEPKNQTREFEISGEEATALFLRYIKNEVLQILSCDEINAVITIPATFEFPESQAIKSAAKEAGFQKIVLKKEPVAAAISYAINENDHSSILVYDFGGGTFDVSVIKRSAEEFDLLAVGGQKNLGGVDLTQDLINYIYEKLETENNLSLFSIEESGLSEEYYNENILAIEIEAERAKKSLSFLETEIIQLANIFTSSGAISVSFEVTRQEFNNIISENIVKTKDYLEEVLIENNLKAYDIDKIILSGGSSLIPLVREKVKGCLGKEPFLEKNAATLISEGAAMLAYAEFSEDKKIIIRRPKVYTKTIAAYGIATENWVFDEIIQASQSLPVIGEKEYYLVEDNQNFINIKIYSRKKGNHEKKVYRLDFLEKIELSNLPQLKQRDVRVVVKFEITKEYEMEVSASVRDKNGSLMADENKIAIKRDNNQ